jgi:putative membrane protein
MGPYYWNDWYSGWGWLLWFGMIFLFFSVVGNYGYTYRAHRKYNDLTPGKGAVDILNERYAKGEISRDEFNRMKSEVATHTIEESKVATRKIG